MATDAELRTWESAPNVRGEVRSLAKRSLDEIERLQKELLSIANNTCCGGCQEAARVARAALRSKDDREMAAKATTLS